MPLILISGFPCAGKTYRSRQLVDNFTSRIQSTYDQCTNHLSICHIDDQSLGISREAYRDAKSEKEARGAEYSAVKRALGKDTIVIADHLNYIKGFRYQLYCEAKALQTPHCVVHVGAPIEKCKELYKLQSANPDNGSPYPEDVFENLIYRYEEPNGMTRWDSPLFTIPYDDEAPPFDAIWSAMVGSESKTKVIKPNTATILKPAMSSDYLYELDKITQEVVSVILEWQKHHPGEGGGEVIIEDNTIALPTEPTSLPQLQRLRRQFISVNRQHNFPQSRIRSSFVEYLNYNLG